MAYPIPGCQLTEGTIREAILMLHPTWRKEIVKLWFEYIPVGMQLTETQQLEWIIASLPGAETCLPGYIADYIKTGPLCVAKPGEPYSKTVIIHNFVSSYPYLAKDVAQVCARNKPIPNKFKVNIEWLCVVAFDYALCLTENPNHFILDYGTNMVAVSNLFQQWLQVVKSRGM